MCSLSKITVNSLLATRRNSHNWFSSKPFDEIPGPLSLPLIGTLYLYLPLIGKYRFDKLHKNGLKNYKLYGPIFKEEIVPGQHVVYLGDPNDIATMYQNEGPYPQRRSHMTLEKYRLDRPHIYNCGGLLPTNGPEWTRIRKVLQKGITSPADALTFIKITDEVISEWIDTRIENIRHDPKIDYCSELSRLYLELVGISAFDIRLQSFTDHEMLPNSQSSKLLESAFVTNSNILKGDIGFQIFQKLRTPAYRRIKKAQKFMESVAIDLIFLKMSTFKEKSDEPPTLLDRYLASPILDFKDIVGAACDFLLAGMDTTTYTTSFLLYHLAKNPQAQETLFQESLKLLPNPCDPVTPDIYNQARFTQCAVKESLRLMPISIGVGRVLPGDVVFSGYNVPKGTLIVTLNQVLSRLEKYFVEPEVYKPERWLRNTPTYIKVHPYIVIPFGHGQRSCIARRLADQNMAITALKLIRKYKLKWMGSDLDCESLLINKPDALILLKLETR